MLEFLYRVCLLDGVVCSLEILNHSGLSSGFDRCYVASFNGGVVPTLVLQMCE